MASVRRQLSRRGFLSTLAVSGAAAAGRGSAQERPVRLPNGFRSVVDLTHRFSSTLPIYPSYNPLRVRPRFTIARDGFVAHEITFDEHTGTHLDAPAHFVPDGSPADGIPPENLIAPLAVVSIVDRAAKDADALPQVDDLLEWERLHGRLPEASFVALHSGWDARVEDSDRFLNRDSAGVMHAPGFSAAASRFLIAERNIVAVGIDTLSLDAGAATKFVAHLELLGAGKYGVELMANLGQVPRAGATIVVGGPKHEGASGGPVRALALF
jgi:kynurenine formamidase